MFLFALQLHLIYTKVGSMLAYAKIHFLSQKNSLFLDKKKRWV